MQAQRPLLVTLALAQRLLLSHFSCADSVLEEHKTEKKQGGTFKLNQENYEIFVCVYLDVRTSLCTYKKGPLLLVVNITKINL